MNIATFNTSLYSNQARKLIELARSHTDLFDVAYEFEYLDEIYVLTFANTGLDIFKRVIVKEEYTLAEFMPLLFPEKIWVEFLLYLKKAIPALFVCNRVHSRYRDMYYTTNDGNIDSRQIKQWYCTFCNVASDYPFKEHEVKL